ncbi:GNAT family N-acetyltransferase [Aerococcaceae bacterium zg-BR22]|uniref:GNAT family N-acetyltransferase n=1 Tax=Aerococcaceae bacterium zg-1292 TaxID=2774330 RepID=UPI0040633B17|nr:GNAT family N-acetyltransferase [Aerococcaceae bacterium zg-BR22]
MMKIEQFNQLTPEQGCRIRALETRVHAQDGTHRQVYLSNQFNLDTTMPYVFLAVTDEQLIGFAVIYADDEAVAEISLLVHPDYRQRGVATALIAAVKSVCSQYQLSKLIFNTEKQFIQTNPEWIKKYYLDDESVNEYLMEWDEEAAKKLDTLTPPLVQVSIATLDDCDAMAQGLAQAFDSTQAMEQRYVMESINDEQTLQYVIKNQQQQIVGVCAVDCRIQNVFYLFALCIFPSYQRKGYGFAAVQQIITDLQRIDSKAKIQLAVEVDNVAAIHLYEQSGFQYIAELVAIVEK